MEETYTKGKALMKGIIRREGKEKGIIRGRH